MGRFSYLKESRVDHNTTRSYEFVFVRGRPIFTVAPASRANRVFWNAVMKEAVVESAAQPKAQKPGTGAKKKPQTVAEAALEVSPAEVAANELREGLRDARLIAEHCVVGWERPPVLSWEEDPAGGEPKVVRCAEFSKDLAREFLEDLATEAFNVFNDFRNWIGNTANFQQLSFEEVDAVAKNS